MSERDQVAQAIYEAFRMIRGEGADEDNGQDWYDPYPWDEFQQNEVAVLISPETDGLALAEITRAADAVLDILGDRLLPEFPEGVDRMSLSRQRNGIWAAFREDLHGYVERDGDGPTPAAAIRAALKGLPT